MTAAPPLRVYLVDDEPLALRRLARLLRATGRVTIVGSTTDPEEALGALSREEVDVVFLDIQMPVLSGFDLLSRLQTPPEIVFTTAYDQYALQAFEVNAIDYLLKPFDVARLERTLTRLEARRRETRSGGIEPAALRTLVDALAAKLQQQVRPAYPDRVASVVGGRIVPLELTRISHFVARDKLTFAVVAGRMHAIDETLTELEARLDPARFCRVHRAILLNLAWVAEVRSPMGGRLVVHLKDEGRTELSVARDRARSLRERLGTRT